MNVRRSRPQIFLLSVSYTESAIFETQTHTLLISLKTVAYRSLDTESSCTLRNTHTPLSRPASESRGASSTQVTSLQPPRVTPRDDQAQSQDVSLGKTPWRPDHPTFKAKKAYGRHRFLDHGRLCWHPRLAMRPPLYFLIKSLQLLWLLSLPFTRTLFINQHIGTQRSRAPQQLILIGYHLSVPLILGRCLLLYRTGNSSVPPTGPLPTLHLLPDRLHSAHTVLASLAVADTSVATPRDPAFSAAKVKDQSSALTD